MKKFLFNFLKFLVAFAAIVNLVFLFVFHYKIPDGLLKKGASYFTSTFSFGDEDKEVEKTDGADEADKSDKAAGSDNVIESGKADGSDKADDSDKADESTEVAKAEPTPELKPMQIVVSANALEYNGSGTLDLLDGVYVTNPDGSRNDTIPVSAEIQNGSSLSEKKITYSAESEEGPVEPVSRALLLGKQYIGPSITVLQGDDVILPELSAETNIDSFVTELRNNGLLEAQDGFGNDISSKVKASVLPFSEEDEAAVVTLSVSNDLGDSYSTELSVPLQPATGVVMKLTTNEVTLNAGDPFSYYDYIAECHDAQGNDLYHAFTVKGDIDTYTPGTYKLRFYCWDDEGVPSPDCYLTVIVK